MSDYANLKHTLIVEHTKKRLQSLGGLIKRRLEFESQLSPKDKSFIQKFVGLHSTLDRYKHESDLDKVLDTIDLAKIYVGVETRESEHKGPLKYEDFVVLELLQYFKHDFFKWVNKPECPNCHSDGENIKPTGAARPPPGNPDGISVIEKYRCTTCSRDVDFPRINNPAKLLETKRGRCGEWVNCFMLILQAVLGADSHIRYVWNNEDHVWCEYYSKSLKRWVHLDPCEAAFDEPNLYCDNWGKQMSWVIGVNDGYIIDLSDKYITNKDKKINKNTTVSNVSLVENIIKLMAFTLMLNYFQQNVNTLDLSQSEKFEKFYTECILLYQQEFVKPSATEAIVLKTTTKGRQTGGGEWTKARGEDGD